jgi:hypothetical protein
MIGPSRAVRSSGKAPVRVEFYTTSYHVSGDVDVARWRLPDVLNEDHSPFVIMENAVREPLPGFAQLGGTELSRAAQYLQIGKASILFAIPHESPEHEMARKAYLSALYSERALVLAATILTPFEVRGTMHLRRPYRMRQALEDLPAAFVPMTHAEAVYLPDTRLRVIAELVVVNRAAAELFALASETTVAAQHGFSPS